jgi:glycosyltransferase involved in cell wall biosynthesis
MAAPDPATPPSHDHAPRVRRVLAFEPWDGGSHAAVRGSISRHSRHDWTWCTLPARGWRWRLRTGAWTLAEQAAEHAARPFDVIVASGLLSLPDLIAALRTGPWAARRGDAAWPPPTVLVMHENQAAYPSGPDGGDERDAHLVLTNLASVSAADAVIWNSDWNRRSLADGVRTMRLRRHDPDPPAAFDPARIETIGEVIWPPVEAPEAEPRTSTRTHADEGVRVVWPHRWEHDKGPEELLELARTARDRAAAGTGPELRWILLGERFGRTPPALETFRREFAAAIEHDGFEPDPAAYRRRLAEADWILSTARHEFFGIAVVEALLAGCLPWLPDRLSYPELLPDAARGLSPHAPPADPLAVRRLIRDHLEPALAANAVGRIDAVIERVTAHDPGS